MRRVIICCLAAMCLAGSTFDAQPATKSKPKQVVPIPSPEPARVVEADWAKLALPGDWKPPIPAGEFPKVLEWTMTPERVPEQPDPISGLRIPLAGEVFLPGSFSRYVLLNQRSPGLEDGYHVWDVVKGKQEGFIPRPGYVLYDLALSADGQLLAGQKTRFPGKLPIPPIEIFSFAEKASIAAIPFTTPGVWKRFEFLDANHLLAVKHLGSKSTVLEVYDIKTGKEVHKFPLTDYIDVVNQVALSPGRKYAAVAQAERIEIFEPLTGKRAGLISLGPDAPLWAGLAFSSDGEELAGIITSPTGTARLVSIKLGEQPKLWANHQLGKAYQAIVAKGNHRGTALTWLPRRVGWLLCGHAITDYATGRVVQYLPSADPGPVPRRFFGINHLSMAKSARRFSYDLEMQPVPWDRITEGFVAARTGQAQAVGELEARRADLSKAATLTASNEPVAWQADADRKRVPAAALTTRPIAIAASPADVQHVVFAEGPTAQGVAIITQADPAVPHLKTVFAEMLDLRKGEATGKFALYQQDLLGLKSWPHGFFGTLESMRADLSPDGARLAIRSLADKKRLDIWDMKTRKHDAGWLPHGDREVTWLQFVDADHLLSAADGQIILWKVPQLEAMYILNGHRNALCLSPGKKWLVAFTGAQLQVLDIRTGAVRGRLQSPEDPLVQALAATISDDGEDLGGYFSSRKGLVTLRWRMMDGTFQGATRRIATSAPPRWLSSRAFLFGSMLYDWKSGVLLCNYQFPREGFTSAVRGCPQSPDGRIWCAWEPEKNAPSTFLAGFALPGKAGQDLLDQFDAGKVIPLLPSGCSIDIQIDTNNERFRDVAKTRLREVLEKNGFKEGSDGVTLKLTAQGAATGRTAKFRLMRLNQSVTLDESKVDCSYQLARGKDVLFKSALVTYTSPKSLAFPNDNYQATYDQATWELALGYVQRLTLPVNHFRVGGEAILLPKTIRLEAE